MIKCVAVLAACLTSTVIAQHGGALSSDFDGDEIYAYAQGDRQLYQAYAAAFSATVLEGDWAAAWSADSAFSYASQCVPSATLYPFPSNPVGPLLNSLTHGTLRVGFVSGATQRSPTTSAVVIDATTNPPTGFVVDWLNELTEELGEAYNRRFLSLSWHLYESSAASFDALQSGQVDMLVALYGIGGTYNGLARQYSFLASPCLSYFTSPPIWVTSASALTTIDDLRQTLLTTNLTIGTAGAAGASTAAANLGAGATIIENGDSAANFAALTAGTFDAVWGSSPASTAGFRTLTAPGTTGVDTVGTFFRRPALSGSADSAIYPAVPITNSIVSTSYPPAGSTSARGREELKLAFAAGFNRAAVKGNWNATFGQVSNLFLNDACTGQMSAFPFPTPTDGGTLAKIIARGSIEAVYVTDSINRSPDGTELLNTFTNPPTGPTVMFWEAIWTEIGLNYGVTFTLPWRYVDSSPAAFAEVESGAVEMLPMAWSVGGTLNSMSRVFQYEPSPCLSYVTDSNMYVQAASPINTIDQLRTAIVAGTATVCGVGAGNTGEASALLDTTVRAVESGAISLVISGECTAAVGGGPNVTESAQVKNIGVLSQRGLSSYFPLAELYTEAEGEENSESGADDDGSGDGFKSATIALAVIACLLIVAIIILVVKRSPASAPPPALPVTTTNPVQRRTPAAAAAPVTSIPVSAGSAGGSVASGEVSVVARPLN